MPKQPQPTPQPPQHRSTPRTTKNRIGGNRIDQHGFDVEAGEHGGSSIVVDDDLPCVNLSKLGRIAEPALRLQWPHVSEDWQFPARTPGI